MKRKTQFKLMTYMKATKKYLTILAVFGNIIFILWVLYNGINEGFVGTLPQKLSHIGLTGLLIVNSFLLLSGMSQQKQ